MAPARRSRPTTPPLTPGEWLPWRWIGAVAAAATLLFVVIWWASRTGDEGAAPAVVADLDGSELQDEEPAEAWPPPDDPSAPPALTTATPAAESAQASTDAAIATSQTPVVAAPPRTAPANRARIEADAAAVRISESAPAAVVVLRRSGNPAGPVTVTWLLEAGSAVEGEDYTMPASRSARFAAGQTARAIYVPLVNDDRSEPEESLSLTFQSPRATIDASRVTITILDDD